MSTKHCVGLFLLFGSLLPAAVLMGACGSTDVDPPAQPDGGGSAGIDGGGEAGKHDGAQAGETNAGTGGGGSAQGGSAQGGSAQGGSAQGGMAQAGMSNGGSSDAGSSPGGAGGWNQGGENQGGDAGSNQGGSSSGGEGGSAGDSGAGGEGGAPPVPTYCDGMILQPLPYKVHDAFQATQWAGDKDHLKADYLGDLCKTRVPDAVGTCYVYTYAPVQSSQVVVTWDREWDAWFTHQPVCLAAGATQVTFSAQGKVGGEEVLFETTGGASTQVTLTTEWKTYSLALPVTYNTAASGVEKPLVMTLKASASFALDNIKIVQ